jgi:hypothetical protein
VSNISTVAELLVKIGGDSAGLRKEIQASQRQLRRAFGPESLDASAKMAAGLGVITAAAGAAAVVAGKMAVSWNLAVNSIEDVTGMSGEAASRLLAVGQMVGLTGEDMSAALVKMSKSAEAAFESIRENGANSTDAYTKFGIAIQDSNGQMLSAEQIYANVAARHREMANGAEKTAMELAIFGKSGAKLNDLLNLTEEQMGTMTARAQKMGLVINSETSQAWESATFEINRAKLGFTAAGNAIMTDLLPAVSSTTSQVADMLEAFAVDTKMHGVTTALKNLIPDELEPAIAGVSSALLVTLYPALKRTALAAWAALGPFGLVPLALGAIAYSAVATGNALEKMGDQADDAVARLNGFNPVGLENVGVAANSARKEMALLFDEYSHMNAGAGGITGAAGAAATGTGTKGAAKAYDELAKAAEQAHKEIYREWVQLTQSQIEQLNIWYDEEEKKLNASASANAEYDKDLTKLKEVYAEKRRKIMLQEAEETQSILKDIVRPFQDMQFKNATFNLDGAEKAFADMSREAITALQGVDDFFAGIETRWAGATEAQRQAIKAALSKAGIDYQIAEGNKLNLTKARAAAELDVEKQKIQKMIEYVTTGQALEDQLAAVQRQNDLAGYVTLLGEKNAAFLAQLEGQQAVMDVYRELQMAAHRTDASMMAELYGTAWQSVSGGLTSAIMGAKSFGAALQDAGKAIIETFVRMKMEQMVAAALGRSLAAASTALAVTQAKLLEQAWKPAAYLANVATMGGASAIGMATLMAGLGTLAASNFATAGGGFGSSAGGASGAAISAAGGLAGNALKFTPPQMASGGITTGRTLAEIGERGKEAVLPLDRRVFERMGLTSGSGTTNQVTQNIYGNINTKADTEEVMEDLGQMVQNAIWGAV